MKGWSARHPVHPCLEGGGWDLHFQDQGPPGSYCWGLDSQPPEDHHHSGSSELASAEMETTRRDAGT